MPLRRRSHDENNRSDENTEQREETRTEETEPEGIETLTKHERSELESILTAAWDAANDTGEWQEKDVKSIAEKLGLDVKPPENDSEKDEDQ